MFVTSKIKMNSMMQKKLKLFYHIPCPEKRTYSRSRNNLHRKCRSEAILASRGLRGDRKEESAKNCCPVGLLRSLHSHALLVVAKSSKSQKSIG